MIGQKLEEKIQFKIDKLLTDFVIKYNQDDDEERIDALHNQTVSDFSCLFQKALDEMDKGIIETTKEKVLLAEIYKQDGIISIDFPNEHDTQQFELYGFLDSFLDVLKESLISDLKTSNQH